MNLSERSLFDKYKIPEHLRVALHFIIEYLFYIVGTKGFRIFFSYAVFLFPLLCTAADCRSQIASLLRLSDELQTEVTELTGRRANRSLTPHEIEAIRNIEGLDRVPALQVTRLYSAQSQFLIRQIEDFVTSKREGGRYRPISLSCCNSYCAGCPIGIKNTDRKLGGKRGAIADYPKPKSLTYYRALAQFKEAELE